MNVGVLCPQLWSLALTWLSPPRLAERSQGSDEAGGGGPAPVACSGQGETGPGHGRGPPRGHEPQPEPERGPQPPSGLCQSEQHQPQLPRQHRSKPGPSHLNLSLVGAVGQHRGVGSGREDCGKKDPCSRRAVAWLHSLIQQTPVKTCWGFREEALLPTKLAREGLRTGHKVEGGRCREKGFGTHLPGFTVAGQ